MSLTSGNLLLSEQDNNSIYMNNIQGNQSEIEERQINYAINLFILHGIFTSFELRTKNL